MFSFLRKNNNEISGQWRTVAELKVGQSIAVPKGNVIDAHQKGEIDSREWVGGDDILWDEIESIEYVGTEQVWDIEVEGTHNFVGNNIFAHNTYLNGSLGVGTSTPWAKLSVNNYSAGASTDPLFVVASSTGTSATSTEFIIDSTGRVGIGASPYTNTFFNVENTDTVQNTSTGVNGMRGYFYASSTIDTATDYRGLYINQNSTGTSNYTGNIFGGIVEALHFGSGSATKVIGLYPGAYNISSGLVQNARAVHAQIEVQGAGNINNAVGVYIESAQKYGAGNIGNNYGIYIQNQTVGTSTNYAMYSEGGTNYFGGSFGVGTTTPFAKLSVQATANQTNPVFEVASSSNATKFLSVAGTGFGTTTVAGLNIAGSATTTSNVGINLSGGCFAIGGTCIGAGSASSASTTLLADSNTWTGVNKFGTLNLSSVAVNSLLSTDASGNIVATSTPTFGNFNATSTTATSTISTGGLVVGGTQFVVQQNSGNVGIGIATPGAKLHVSGNTYITSGSLFLDTIGHYSGGSTPLNIGTTNQLSLSPYGYIGIGTTTPSYINQLTIASSTSSQLSLSAGAGLAQWAFRNAGGNLYLATTTVAGTATTTLPAMTIIGSSGYVGIRNSNPSAVLDIKGVSADSYVQKWTNSIGNTIGAMYQLGGNGGYFTLNDGANNEVIALRSDASASYINNSGNFGIGTTTPYSKLSVWGGTTGNALEVVNSASTTLLSVSATGFGTTTVSGLNIAGSATTTSNVGINLTDGCFAVNGVCVGGGTGSGSGTVNSGVFGQLAFYGANGTAVSGTSTITIATTTNSGRVGIATSTNLNATLTLQGAAGLDILRIATSTSGANVLTISQWGGFTQKISSTTAFSIQRESGAPVFEVDTTSDTNSGIDITASAGQSSNLLNLYSSAGAFLSGFTSSGGLFMNISSTTAINLYDGSGVAAFVVDSTGKKVGIGTSTLTYNLNVSGDSSASYIARINNANAANTADGLLISLGVANASRTTGNYFIGFSDGGQTVAGKIQGGASAVAYTTTAADLAEYFRASDLDNKPEKGDIVMLDSNEENSVKVADISLMSGKEPIGVISTNPGFVGNGPICFVEDEDCDTNYENYNVLVAMVGQVPVRVSDENGEVVPGDYLTLSSTTPGTAVKMIDGGYTIGMAMTYASSTEVALEDGSEMVPMVKVFIKGGWREVDMQTENGLASSLMNRVLGYMKSLGLEIGNNFVKIVNLAVDKITADRVETKQLCIEDVCVDKTQLQALLLSSGQSGTIISNPATTTDPIITDPIVEPIVETPATSTDPVVEVPPVVEPVVETPPVVEPAPEPIASEPAQ